VANFFTPQQRVAIRWRRVLKRLDRAAEAAGRRGKLSRELRAAYPDVTEQQLISAAERLAEALAEMMEAKESGVPTSLRK